MKQNVLLDKTFAFSVEIVKLVRKLQIEEKEYVLSRQLLKAATSIGANAEEAMAGESQADFLAKLIIAHKEARETKYWLRLITASCICDCSTYLNSVEEILRIISSIIITTKNNRADSQ
ncbi:MAG: four helix bundle protein [Candidatus Cloacimonadaceae bacterium]